MVKFRKGDKVCALLVSNRFGVDFNLMCGRLVNIEERGVVLAAKIMVTTCYFLYSKTVHKPTEFNLDIRLFKLLPWNKETRTYVKELRAASRTLHTLTCKVKSPQTTRTRPK